MFDKPAPMPTPTAPPPPPNPPMFGRDAYGSASTRRNPTAGFGGTLLGSIGSATANVAGKTLLGQ